MRSAAWYPYDQSLWYDVPFSKHKDIHKCSELRCTRVLCQSSPLRHSQAGKKHTDINEHLRMQEGGIKNRLSCAHTTFVGMSGQQLGSQYC